jgi:hypothetical protein
MCNEIARTCYGRPYPKYEDIEVIPDEGGQQVKWVSLADDKKWELLQAGSKGTGGRQAVANIQDFLDSGRSFSDSEIQRIIRQRLCTEGRISTVHDAGHAQRCAALTLVFAELYAKIFQFPALTEDERTVLQIAAMFHDSGRQGDGSDVWEEISAQNVESYLRRAGFAEYPCKLAGDTIRGKGAFAQLLHDADCLEYMRVRGGKGFDPGHLAISQLPLREGITEDMRQTLLGKIVEGEQQFIQRSHHIGIDYSRHIDCAREIFAIEPPPPVVDAKALALVTQFARQASQYAGKLGISLPTGIELLQNVKSVKIDWSASANGCRSVLRQLGQNVANESNEDAIYLGRNIESLLICCCAIADGRVSSAKLQSFASGMFSRTYTFSECGHSRIFKPIIPSGIPCEIDMERRYGISQFTRSAREMIPHKLIKFLNQQAAKTSIQIPDVHVEADLEIVDGQPGIVMEKASETDSKSTSGKDALQCAAAFRREETWLQLMDCLLGQQDRHSGNVFWDGQQRHIKAIDQDISFPDGTLRYLAKFTDRHKKHRIDNSMLDMARMVDLPNSVPLQLRAPAQDGGRCFDGLAGYTNYCMPPVIDTEMKDVFLNIDKAALQEFFRNEGLIDRQIEAAVNRLESIKTHITKGPVRVIAPGAWGNDALSECAAQNTYFMWHMRANLFIRNFYSASK